MSDLRLEDLRLVQCLPSCEVDHDRMVPTHHRPVTRAEVLEALGAEKRWVCEVPELNAYRCDGEAPAGAVHPAWLRKHSICGWGWVVTDA